MTVVTLSLLLLSFLMGIYLATQKSYRLQEDLNAVQENARTAIEILDTDIKQAGYLGCPRLAPDFPIISNLPFTLSTQNKLSGKKLDLITTRHAGLEHATLIESMQDDLIFFTTNKPRYSPGDILIISDCKSAEIFQAENIFMKKGIQEIISTQPLHKQYEKNSEVSRFEMNSYYVGKTNRRRVDGIAIFALYREDSRQYRSEVVEGVDKMQIHYTINQQGTIADITADEVSDWSKVVGVAVDLEVSAGSLHKTWHSYISLSGG